MSAVFDYTISGWHIIIFLFSISLIIGTLGLYYGLRCRNKLKEIESLRVVRMTDVCVILLMIYFISKSMIFWFVDERFDWTPLETSWVAVDNYSNIGMACFMYIFMAIFIKFNRGKKKNDVN